VVTLGVGVSVGTDGDCDKLIPPSCAGTGVTFMKEGEDEGTKVVMGFGVVVFVAVVEGTV